MVDWPLWKVYGMLQLYFQRGQVHVVSDSSGAIGGMVIAVPEDNSYLRIEQIICTSTGAFKVLRMACKAKYPGMDLIYFRHKYGKQRKLSARKV